jgi:hypothetical protein
MKSTFLTLLIVMGLISSASAQNAPAPCGPAGDLSAGLSSNVDANSRCFEIRMYTAQPDEDGAHGIDELHQRFREEEVAIFERLGAEVVAVWQRLDNPNTLVWMLAYRDRAHRQEVWDAFVVDAEWLALRAKYPVSVSPEVYMMSATDYSRLK